MTTGYRIGLRANNRPLVLPWPLAFHLLIAGETGSGKSSLLQSIIYALSGRRDVAFCGIDPKFVEFQPWVPRFSVLALEMSEIDVLIGNLVKAVDYRKRILAAQGLRTWDTVHGPVIVVPVDEMAELGGIDAATLASAITDPDGKARSNAIRDGKNAMQFRIALLASLARQARFVGIWLICATQYPSAEVIDQQIRTQLTVKAMLRVSRDEQIRVILGGSETPAVTVGSIPKNERGGLWVTDLPGEAQPVRARASLVGTPWPERSDR